MTSTFNDACDHKVILSDLKQIITAFCRHSLPTSSTVTKQNVGSISASVTQNATSLSYVGGNNQHMVACPQHAMLSRSALASDWNT